MAKIELKKIADNKLPSSILGWFEEVEAIVLTQEQAKELFPVETVISAVEFGYISCEKGNNLQKALIDAQKLLTDK